MSISHDATRRKPILMVTGASGSLGHWVCRLAQDAWYVYGLHWRHDFNIPGTKAVRMDVTRTKEVKQYFDTLNPQAIIHAAAVSQTGACEADPKACHGINVSVPRYLAALCRDKGIPFLFTSTDLVFDGLNAPYQVDSPVRPVCVYGRQKARAEAAVLEAYPGALVCRMPLMFGLGPRFSGNFSIQMLTAIEQGRSVSLLTDEFRTPVDFESAARGLLEILGRTEGLLHLGGRVRVSRYELGLLMAEKMGVTPSMLRPITIEELPVSAARSPDCSLNSDEAYGKGYDPIPLSKAVKREVDRFNLIHVTRRKT